MTRNTIMRRRFKLLFIMPVWLPVGLCPGACLRNLGEPPQGVTHEKNPVSGAVIAIQTFGDVLGFNPHCHILVTEGCFYQKGCSGEPLIWN